MASAAVAAGAWGVSDFLGGLLSRRLPVLTILIGSKVAGLLLAVLVVAVRAVPPPDDPRLLLAVVAGLLGLPAVGLLLRAMRDGSMAVVAPVAAVAALVPVGWGLVRGERFGLLSVVGIAVALVGVTLAGWPVGAAERRRIRRSANLCALGAALGFGLYFVLLHEAGGTDQGGADQFWATAVARISGGIGALILAAVFRNAGRRAGVRGGKWLFVPVAAVGVFDAVGDAAFAAAAAGSLGLAAMLASMYPAVTVLLNRSLRREKMHTVHVYGVLAALCAVACLAR